LITKMGLCKLFSMSLGNMLLPAFLMHVNSTFSTVVNMGSGFFAADRALHDLLSPSSISFSFLFNPLASDFCSLSSLESVM